MKIVLSLLLFLVSTTAFADDHFITRRDAYVHIWNSISRPAFHTAKEYIDVPEEHVGHVEISYGKRRGILPDEDYFVPDEPVLLSDALLWIYRTRNIRELPDMQEEDLPSMISDYPIVAMNAPLESRTTKEELTELMQKLDGLLENEIHTVSFYADDFHGNGTAFGETFDMNAITAAHRSLPHNTLVKVTNVENKKSVVVRINDRGPYVHGRNMDLSKAAFAEIAHTGQGILRAKFKRLGDAELIDACKQAPTLYQKRITRDKHFFRGVPHTFTLGNQLVLQSNKVFVVLGITFPDGQYIRVQDFVLPEEKYRFSPDSVGKYTFLVGDAAGRQREMRMQVNGC